MLMLSKNLGAITHVASKDDGRFSLRTVRVQEFADNHYTISATDGRIAVMIRGIAYDNPPWSDLLRLNNDCFDYLIDPKEWQLMFSKAQRHGSNPMPYIGICAQAEVKADVENNLPGEPAKVIMTDGKLSTTTPTVEGRFPDIMQVMPKKPARFAVTVDAGHLIRLLEAAVTVSSDNGRAPVTLHFWSEDSVFGVAARNNEGQIFDGLIMPLSDNKPQSAKKTQPVQQPEPISQTEDEDTQVEPESEPPADAEPIIVTETQAKPCDQPECNGHMQSDLPGAEPTHTPAEVASVNRIPPPRRGRRGKK